MSYYDKKSFTKEELRKYDGSNGVAYIAFEGRVYDVSVSFHWKKGIHQVMHRAGCDLTEALRQAPHGPDMLDRFPIVGKLLDSGKSNADMREDYNKYMRTVLFVCVHNSGRSQMAEAYFNLLAKGKAKGLSAGTQPADKLNPMVVEAMKEAGIDISGNKPKMLTIDMVEKTDKVITMGCGVEGVCPASFVETKDWELEDPKGKTLDEVRKIRDEIRAKVVGLLKEMEQNSN